MATTRYDASTHNTECEIQQAKVTTNHVSGSEFVTSALLLKADGSNAMPSNSFISIPQNCPLCGMQLAALCTVRPRLKGKGMLGGWI